MADHLSPPSSSPSTSTFTSTPTNRHILAPLVLLLIQAAVS